MKVLAPMAGITDGLFCRKLAPQGFDMVILGGYNIDTETIHAGEKIIERGRSEFPIPLEDISNHIEKQIKIIKEDESWQGLISVNLRSVTPQPVVDISKIPGVDVVEINAHCRQPEIMELGCGQSLLSYPDELYEYTLKVTGKAQSKVSVKVRANVPGTDLTSISKLVEEAGADFLHVDAMKPGAPHADYETISTIRKASDIFIIGNNSIKDLKSAREMLNAGARGISMARALICGEVPFDLSRI